MKNVRWFLEWLSGDGFAVYFFLLMFLFAILVVGFAK